MGHVLFGHLFTTRGSKQHLHMPQLLTEKGPLGVSTIGETPKRIYSITNGIRKLLFKQLARHVRKYCIEGAMYWQTCNVQTMLKVRGLAE